MLRFVSMYLIILSFTYLLRRRNGKIICFCTNLFKINKMCFAQVGRKIQSCRYAVLIGIVMIIIIQNIILIYYIDMYI